MTKLGNRFFGIGAPIAMHAASGNYHSSTPIPAWLGISLIVLVIGLFAYIIIDLKK